MSICTFSPSSTVAAVRFSHANDRPPVALITAGAHAQAERLASLTRFANAQKWGVQPVTVEGKDALQLSNFGSEEDLLGVLRSFQLTSGNPTVTSEPCDRAERSWKEFLADTSLKGSGWAYLVGDMALLTSGLMSQRSHEITAGALYTAGGLNLIRYGNMPTEYHLKQTSEELAKFLQQQAGQLPENTALFHLLKERKEGTLPNLDRLLARYPSQATLGLYTMGAVQMLMSGLKHGKAWDTSYGAISTGAKVASLIIPEKKPDADHAPKGWLDATWSWIQEKPLRVMGYTSMVGAMAMGMSAYKEYKANPAQRSYIFKFATAATYLIGDFLFAVSSKNHITGDGKLDEDERRQLFAQAAETIRALPAPAQDAMVHYAASFLSQRPEMGMDAAGIRAAITEQCAGLKHNRWQRPRESGIAFAPGL